MLFDKGSGKTLELLGRSGIRAMESNVCGADRTASRPQRGQETEQT